MFSGTTFVREVCMTFEYVCKPVFCDHNLHVEATYIQVKGIYDLLYKHTCTYFFVTTWPNQMGSSLKCRKIVIS